jgi:hypothetical protein
LARKGDKKYRAKLTNLKNRLQYDYGFVHFLLKNPSKVRAQKWPKIIAPAVLASNAAGTSVAVSNDNDVGFFYQPDPEISDAGDLS